MKEIKLLSKGHTSLINSAKNIGIDLVGTGGGGATGCWTGATIGSLILPGIGTLIGGLIGGWRCHYW